MPQSDSLAVKEDSQQHLTVNKTLKGIFILQDNFRFI